MTRIKRGLRAVNYLRHMQNFFWGHHARQLSLWRGGVSDQRCSSPDLSVPLLALPKTRRLFLQFSNHNTGSEFSVGCWTTADLVLREINGLSFRLLFAMRFSGAERSQSYRVLLGSCRSTRWGAAPRDWSASVCRLQGFLGQYYFRKPAV